MCLTHFAARLKDLMELEGVSQRSLSIHLKVDRKCIRCWLSALYFPKYNVLIKLAAYFKVRIDYLVGLEDDIGDGREYAYPVEVSEKSLDRLHTMLKEYMETKKLTEYTLANKIGIDLKAFKKWLTQNSKPEVDSIIKLARVMGVSMQELLVGEQETLTI